MGLTARQRLFKETRNTCSYRGSRRAAHRSSTRGGGGSRSGGGGGGPHEPHASAHLGTHEPLADSGSALKAREAAAIPSTSHLCSKLGTRLVVPSASHGALALVHQPCAAAASSETVFAEAGQDAAEGAAAAAAGGAAAAARSSKADIF